MLLLLNQSTSLLLKSLLLLFGLQLLLLSFVRLVHDTLQSLFKKRLQLLVVSQVELNQSALSRIPSLTWVMLLLVLLEQIPHLAFNRLLTAFWVFLVEIVDDLLFALERAVHHFYKFF